MLRRVFYSVPSRLIGQCDSALVTLLPGRPLDGIRCLWIDADRGRVPPAGRSAGYS